MFFITTTRHLFLPMVTWSVVVVVVTSVSVDY